MSQNIKVRLMGKAAELTGSHEISVQVNSTTPKDVIAELAKANPLLEDNILRGDGTPRSSTKLLINGKPPKTLDEQINFESDVILSINMPCDG